MSSNKFTDNPQSFALSGQGVYLQNLAGVQAAPPMQQVPAFAMASKVLPEEPKFDAFHE